MTISPYSLDLRNKLIKYLKSTIRVYRILADMVKIQNRSKSMTRLRRESRCYFTLGNLILTLKAFICVSDLL